MAKHFIDHSNAVKAQTFSCAAIIDGKGKSCGRIIIRYTKSHIGYNHEVGVQFYDGANPKPADINFNQTEKGGTYDSPSTLFKMLAEKQFKCFTFNKNPIMSPKAARKYNADNQESISKGLKRDAYSHDSLSRFSEVNQIKLGRKTYSVHWVLS